MNHVVFLSGGKSSWAAAKRVAATHGTDDLHLVFTDVLGEDASTYRFLIEGAADVMGVENVGDLAERAIEVPPFTSDENLERRKDVLPEIGQAAEERIPGFHYLADGRTVWDVFFDVSYLGNTRADPCSRVLKREMAHDFVEEHFDPEDTTLYVGIDWTEVHRMEGVWAAWKPYECKAPLMDPPRYAGWQINEMIRERGVEPPDLYALGHPHSNCSGACVKQGHGGWALLLEKRPEVYAYWERKEQEIREELGDVAILRDRRGGTTDPMTLRALRERLASEGMDQQEMFAETRGCGGCFVDYDEDEAA